MTRTDRVCGGGRILAGQCCRTTRRSLGRRHDVAQLPHSTVDRSFIHSPEDEVTLTGQLVHQLNEPTVNGGRTNALCGSWGWTAQIRTCWNRSTTKRPLMAAALPGDRANR